MQGVNTKDVIVNPHDTISPHRDPLYKDPGYFELNKRGTRSSD